MSEPTWPGSDRFRELGLSNEEPAFPSRPPEEGDGHTLTDATTQLTVDRRRSRRDSH